MTAVLREQEVIVSDWLVFEGENMVKITLHNRILFFGQLFSFTNHLIQFLKIFLTLVLIYLMALILINLYKAI